MMSLISAWPQIAIVVCIVIYVCLYLRGIQKGRVRPVLATWLFFSVATVLSAVTDFRESGVHNLAVNAFNLADTCASLLICAVILISKKYERKPFTPLDKACWAAVVLTFLLWLISGQNVVAHLSIQVILVVAYIPTLIHLWNAEKNTESFGMWFFDFAASSFGLIQPIGQMALLPLVYGIRSVLSTIAVMALIVRLKYKKSTKRL